MGFYEDADADAIEILSEVGKSATIQHGLTGIPVSITVMIGPTMVMEDLETGGFVNSTSFDVKILRSYAISNLSYVSGSSPGLVAYGNLINYNGSQYRIHAVNDRPPSAWIICRVVTVSGSN